VGKGGTVPDMTFAVGDIHGRADLLEPLQESMLAAARGAGAASPHVVYLGDYVDRGPGSREVVDLLLDGLPAFGRTYLKGNHEELMAYLVGPAFDMAGAAHWLRSGGLATLRSYGVACKDEWDFMDRPDEVREALFAAMGERHREFLAGLQVLSVTPGAIFVHAGLDPACDIDGQDEHSMLWIREPFLRSAKDWGARVWHGHTPSKFGPRATG
jgi:serine/threonine protein phosphatase 1